MDKDPCIKTLSYELVHHLPKIDLHSHLSGSIGQEKLSELLKNRHQQHFEKFDCLQAFGSITEANKKCFNYFDAVYKVVTDLVALKECTTSVLDMFASENCVYLELRTEPKSFEIGKSTAEQYVDVVQECITELNTPVHRMDVKLCLSIKRDHNHTTSIEAVVEKLDKIIMVSKKYSDLVVGIDICGNPLHDTIISKILPALLQRQECFKSIPILFHIGEVENDEECDAVIDHIERLNIRRLGHVIQLKEHHINKLNSIGEKGYVLGIEMCPTSNQVASQWKDMKSHHFGKWWCKCSPNLLFSINTDDRGLFSCTLTGEIHKLANCFGLTIKDLCDIQKQAIQSSLSTNKEEIIKQIDHFYNNCVK